MRELWPIEREVLELTIVEYPAAAEVLRIQIDSAKVASFENSGAGFFSDLVVGADVPLLAERSTLNSAHGAVLGVEDGMGFIVFLENGRLSQIEGYCNGNVSTVELDFSRIVFGLVPWTPTKDAQP